MKVSSLPYIHVSFRSLVWITTSTNCYFVMLHLAFKLSAFQDRESSSCSTSTGSLNQVPHVNLSDSVSKATIAAMIRFNSNAAATTQRQFMCSQAKSPFSNEPNQDIWSPILELFVEGSKNLSSSRSESQCLELASIPLISTYRAFDT